MDSEHTDDRPRCCTCGPGDHHSYQCEWGFCNGERCPNGAADRAHDKISPASCCTSPINDRLAARPWGAEWQRVLYELEQSGLPILDCDADVAYLDGYVAYRERPPAELVAALGKTWRTEPAGEGFEAWCDGSATTKDKPAGVGVVLTEFRWEETPRLTLRESSIEVAEHVGNGTNQYAELMAVWRALTLVPNLAAPLVINTDSRYAIGCVTDLTWKIRSHGELVARIRLDLSKRGDKVRFKHVAGHAGIEGNERADHLAKQGRLSGGGE